MRAPDRHSEPVRRKVVLYTRPGCHLCDDARAALRQVRATVPFELHEVDIETSDTLLGEYGLRIPVVVIDGDEAFEYSVDPLEMEAVLRR
jgi:glutaredoxin